MRDREYHARNLSLRAVIAKPTSPLARARFRDGATCVSDPQAIRPVRQISEQALSRASGAPLVPGNRVRVLEDAAGNYPRWLEAIHAARRVVYLENYIIEEDEVGRAFAEALSERARAGVKVRLIRDWLGTRRGASRGFWRRLSAARRSFRKTAWQPAASAVARSFCATATTTRSPPRAAAE